MKAVFLDRDGVLVEAPVVDGRPVSVLTAEEMVLLPGVGAACSELRHAGWLLIGITNQPNIARRVQSAESVERQNRRLREELGLHDVRVCPHDDGDRCDCRKPLPGLIVGAARDWGIDLGNSVMVGDRSRDIEAGRKAGCRTVLVDHGYTGEGPRDPDVVVGSLAEAVPYILSHQWESPAAR